MNNDTNGLHTLSGIGGIEQPRKPTRHMGVSKITPLPICSVRNQFGWGQELTLAGSWPHFCGVMNPLFQGQECLLAGSGTNFSGIKNPFWWGQGPILMGSEPRFGEDILHFDRVRNQLWWGEKPTSLRSGTHFGIFDLFVLLYQTD